MKLKMNKYFPAILIATLLFTIIFIGCEDSLTGPEIDKIIIPDKNVSYSKYIQPLLTIKCSTSDCHNNSAMAGGYSVDNYSTVIMPGIVNPGNVETSILVWRIKGQSGELMPPPLIGHLTKNQIDGITTWIKEDAENN